MDTKTLVSLRPAGQTAAEIQAALDRIAVAKRTAENVATSATTKLARDALTLNSKERRELSDAAEDAVLDARQLDGLAAELKIPLDQARSRERMAASVIARKELSARMVAHHARFEAEYPALHETLSALMAERRALSHDIEAHNRGGLNEVDGSGLGDALNEIGLLKTAEQREYDAVPFSIRQLMAQTAAAREAALARGPRVINAAIPAPILTVDGALVDITRAA